MHLGTVKFYNRVRRLGFIQPVDGDAEIFVHASALDRAGIVGLTEGLEHTTRRGQRIIPFG